MSNEQVWPAHSHGPSEGRGLDCGEKLIGWCIRLAKDAEIADLRAALVNMDRLVTEANRDADAAEAKVARVREVSDDIQRDGWVDPDGIASAIRAALEAD